MFNLQNSVLCLGLLLERLVPENWFVVSVILILLIRLRLGLTIEIARPEPLDEQRQRKIPSDQKKLGRRLLSLLALALLFLQQNASARRLFQPKSVRWVQAIRTGKVKARSLSPIMPWYFYRNMTDEDLKAVYAYIRTLKPVKHTVDNTESPTDCRLCGMKHGGGD